MTMDEALEKLKEDLCFYDERSSYYDIDLIKPDECYCHNCYYGRHERANALLKYVSFMKGDSNV